MNLRHARGVVVRLRALRGLRYCFQSGLIFDGAALALEFCSHCLRCRRRRDLLVVDGALELVRNSGRREHSLQRAGFLRAHPEQLRSVIASFGNPGSTSGILFATNGTFRTSRPPRTGPSARKARKPQLPSFGAQCVSQLSAHCPPEHGEPSTPRWSSSCSHVRWGLFSAGSALNRASRTEHRESLRTISHTCATRAQHRVSRPSDALCPLEALQPLGGSANALEATGEAAAGVLA